MCGRYYIADEDQDEELWAIMEALNRRSGGAEAVKRGEIFPRDTAPVLANNRILQETPFAMVWGYTLPGGKAIINARSETAADKPLFRDGMANRRCLIPASWYFEWEKRGKEKVKYAIRPEGKGMFYMAGIYRLENQRPVFTILTRSPAESIAFMHDRMPVILPRELKSDWLNPRYAANDVLRSAQMNMRYTKSS